MMACLATVRANISPDTLSQEPSRNLWEKSLLIRYDFRDILRILKTQTIKLFNKSLLITWTKALKALLCHYSALLT